MALPESPFKDTWPAYQKDDIDLFALDTDVARFDWAKPTIYREHETIHVLLNTIDQLRKALNEAQDECPFDCDHCRG